MLRRRIGRISSIKNAHDAKYIRIMIQIDGSNEYIPVLFTEHGIKESIIRGYKLYAYSLIKKIKEHHFMIDYYDSTVNDDDYAGTIISYKPLSAGSTVIRDNGSDLITLFNYANNYINPIRLFVAQDMHGVDINKVLENMDKVKKTLVVLYDRKEEDITILDQVNVDDPYDVDENFATEKERRIYRLSRSLRMLPTATHVIFLSDDNPGTTIEKGACIEYEIPFWDKNQLKAAVSEKYRNTDRDDIKDIFNLWGWQLPRKNPWGSKTETIGLSYDDVHVDDDVDAFDAVDVDDDD